MVAESRGKGLLSQLMIVDVVVHEPIAQAERAERGWLDAIAQLSAVSLAQTDGSRNVRRYLRFQRGAGIEEQRGDFFRIEAYTYINAALVLLVECIVQVIFPLVVLEELVADVGVVGVGEDDGGGLLDALDAIEAILLQVTTFH